MAIMAVAPTTAQQLEPLSLADREWELRPQLIVTTDIGQDPDDQQSMVRLIHYLNDFRLLGVVVNADNNADYEAAELKDSIVHAIIDSYAEVENQLRLHSSAYPRSAYLHSVVKRGTERNGREVPVEEYIGEGHDTEGSDFIYSQLLVSKEPVVVAVWGGAADLAQALYRARQSLATEQLAEFVAKLRVYSIGKQDSSVDWILAEFPGLWLILAAARADDRFDSAYRGMYLQGDEDLTSREWLREMIIGQNPITDHYPDKAWTGDNPHGAMKEGDTPSFLFFLPNHLNHASRPEWGGWGGRFDLRPPTLYRDAKDTYANEAAGDTVSNYRASVFRWRSDFQSDFAARVQWAVSSYDEANHHPQLRMAGMDDFHVLHLKAEAGSEVQLDASESRDPDDDSLTLEWMWYPELSSYPVEGMVLSAEQSRCTVRIPQDAKGTTLHLLVRAKDSGHPYLCDYGRVVIFVR